MMTRVMEGICPPNGILDLSTTCARTFWSALFPSCAVLIILLLSIPLSSVPASIRYPFQNFLTLSEAIALSNSDEPTTLLDASEGPNGGKIAVSGQSVPVPLWRTLILSWISMAQTLVWLAVAAYAFSVHASSSPFLGGLPALCIALTYLYSTLRPVIAPQPTPSFDLLTVFALHFMGGSLMLGGFVFDYAVWGQPMPGTLLMASLIANLVLLAIGLSVILATPVGVISGGVKEEDVVSLDNCFVVADAS